MCDVTSLATMPSSRSLLIRVLKSRWFVIAAGIWVQIVSGAAYDFAIYSESIKESLGYDQEELDSISFSKALGANVGIIAGLLYDWLPTWTLLGIGAVLSFFGFFMTWLSITAKIRTPSLWLMCLYSLLAANASTFSNTVVVVTSVRIYPGTRGMVLGLMKGCVGLSGAVLVQLYYAAFGSKAEAFPLLVAWVAAIMYLTFMFVIRPLPVVETGNEKKSLNMFSAIVGALAAYLFGTIILQNCVALARLWNVVIFGGTITLLLFPIWVVVKSELEFELDSSDTAALLCTAIEEKIAFSHRERIDEEFDPSQGAEMCQEARLQSQSGILACRRLNAQGPITSQILQGSSQPQRGENFNLLQAILSLDFWLLFLISGCAMGSGLTTIDNMSQVGSSLGYSSKEVSTFVSLWCIWNFLGRLGGGYISELYFHSRGISRPVFMIVNLGAMVIGHVIIATAFSGALYIGPVLIGICYGAQWSLMPSIASELFGLNRFASVFNSISVASPLSSYVLSVKVLGYLYDMEAEKGSSGLPISQARLERWFYSLSDSSSCIGAKCFRVSFFIMAGVCVAGALISTVLFLRTRAFYRERFSLFKMCTSY